MQSPLYCVQTDKNRRVNKHGKPNFKNKITKSIHHILENSCENYLLQFKSPKKIINILHNLSSIDNIDRRDQILYQQGHLQMNKVTEMRRKINAFKNVLHSYFFF